MDIKVLVSKLCKKYDTRDPFEIARQRDVIVLRESLGGIHGYYAKTHKHKVIHINQALNPQQQIFTCGHELAHSIIHPDTNTPFLRAATMFSVDKLEIQANRFSLEMVYSDEELQPFLFRPIIDAAAYMGVPLPLAEYRMSTVEPTFFSHHIEC